MNTRKRFAVTTLFFSLILIFITACGNSNSSDESGEVNWKLNHIRPVDTRTDISAHKFVDDVQNQTDNRVNIEVYDNSQLGDYQEVQESVTDGEIEMQLATLGTTVDPTLQVSMVPNLVKDWDEAWQLYNSENGVLNKYLSDQLEKQNIKLLAVYPQYFGSVFLAKDGKDIKDPYSSKELKVRVPSMKSFEEYGKETGYIVTPLPITETFTSLQTGVVDGIIGGGTELYYNDYAELGKYILPVNTHLEAHYLTVNKDAFDSLSKEDKESILEISKTFEEDAFEQAREEEDKYNELIEEEGVEVIELSDDELEAYADKVRQDVWPKLEDEFGDIFTDIKNELGID